MFKRQKLSHIPSPDNDFTQSRPAAQTGPSGKTTLILPGRPMNPLPLPASHPRPGHQLFICGAGDCGQLGLGTTPEATQELRRPRLHVAFELAMATNMLGDRPGAGIERATAGGMHSLIIDEAGRVRAFQRPF